MKEEKEVIEIKKADETINNNTSEQTKKDKKNFCIASLVLGIVALVFFCIWYISIPCAILAIIFGILGIKSENKGMAIAGLITGSIGFIISIILIGLIIFGIFVGVKETIDDIDIYDHSLYNCDYY